MIDFKRKRKQTKEPDLVPMINIIFLLLLFFLVAGTISPGEIYAIDVPEGNSGTPFTNQQKFVIVINKDGKYSVDGNEAAEHMVIARAAQFAADSPGQIVTLKADALLPASTLTEITRALEQAGVKELAIITAPK